MLNFYNHKQLKEKKEKASVRGKAGAKAKWDRVKTESEARPPDKPMPDPMRRVTVEDFLTGISHVMTWHWIGKVRSFEIRVDGKYWKIGAWTESP